MGLIKEDFICPNCKEKNRIKVYQTITNDLLEKVFDRSLFTFACKKCGETVTLDYPTKYICDDFHVYYEPKRGVIKDNHPLSRVCYEYDDFKEKILILNDNYNDILICFLKCYIMDSLKEEQELVTDIRYNDSDESSINFYLMGLNKFASIPVDFYINLEKNTKIKKTSECIMVDNITFRDYFKMR